MSLIFVCSFNPNLSRTALNQNVFRTECSHKMKLYSINHTGYTQPGESRIKKYKTYSFQAL